jgi:hypothetical protein
MGKLTAANDYPILNVKRECLYFNDLSWHTNRILIVSHIYILFWLQKIVITQIKRDEGMYRRNTDGLYERSTRIRLQKTNDVAQH